MSLNYQKWINEYRKRYSASDSIDYFDKGWQTDTDPEFTSISGVLQSRSHIKKKELVNIAQWKVQSGRLDRHTKANQSNTVETHSRIAFNSKSKADSVDKLTELQGVGVPVASTILTMYDPNEYSIIDFRALRALAAVRPQLADSQNYQRYSDFIGHILDYGTNPQSYEFFMREVSQICNKQNLSPRQVDMALWTFDKMN